jgi:hypothetical protein
MPDKDSALNAHDIRGDPIHKSAETAKSPVHDHEVSFGHDRSGFVLQRRRDALDEIEQTVAPGCDMSAALNVVRRPESFCGRAVTLVESVSNASKTRALFCSGVVFGMLIPFCPSEF